jgi:pimeloyl-ACP methyl ester carboxylesterase
MNRVVPAVALSLAIILGAMAPIGAIASDTAKEARWAEQIVDSLLDGEALWLDDGSGHEFLGIITEGDADSGRAVILVHGIGVHPNWPDIIYPLRIGLLENDITNLSIQMPILANDAEDIEYADLYSEVPARFNAALAYLQENGYRQIIIVAHSMGATMSTYYLERNDADAIESLVIIGMPAALSYPGNIEALAKIRVPILDLYGSKDLVSVLENSELRARSANKQTQRQYSQVRVDGANHFFQGHEDELLRQVLQWLAANET